MKIYTRSTFMDLSDGTMFAKGQKWHFDGLCVKGRTIASDGRNFDFEYRSFEWVDADCSGEAIDKLEGMLNEGASVPVQVAYQRDGCYDKKDIFLVFEKEDLLNLKETILSALSVDIAPIEALTTEPA